MHRTNKLQQTARSKSPAQRLRWMFDSRTPQFKQFLPANAIDRSTCSAAARVEKSDVCTRSNVSERNVIVCWRIVTFLLLHAFARFRVKKQDIPVSSLTPETMVEWKFASQAPRVFVLSLYRIWTYLDILIENLHRTAGAEDRKNNFQFFFCGSFAEVRFWGICDFGIRTIGRGIDLVLP